MSTLSRLRQTREAILAYLQQHPDAADTEAGIACWWLPDHLSTHPSQVAQAQETLVKDGLVTQQVNGDRQTLYFRAPGRKPP